MSCFAARARYASTSGRLLVRRQRVDERMLGRQHQVRGAEDRVRTRREDANVHRLRGELAGQTALGRGRAGQLFQVLDAEA